MKTPFQSCESNSIGVVGLCKTRGQVAARIHPMLVKMPIAVLQSLSHVLLFVIPWTPGFPVFHYLPESAPTHVRWVSDTIHPSHPLCPLLPSVFPSIKVFSSELALCIKWPKYWSFSFSISPSNEYSGLISFRIDWFDLLAIQGTLKSLLQHHSSKASVLQLSAFMVQLSHLYETTGEKNHSFD